MNTTPRNTPQELERAIAHILRELSEPASIFEKEELRAALAELAFLYTQHVPKYRVATA